MSRPTYLRDVCWNEGDVLCLQNEASTPSEADDPHRGKHVFDAIHTPPPLFHYVDVRRFVAGAGETLEGQDVGSRTPTDQQRLLDAIDEGMTAGRNLLFVAGATGAGKSHMVRWLHAQYSETNPSALTIHVRRRDTDLVTVVRRLASAFGSGGAALQKLVDDAETPRAATTSAFLNTTLVAALSSYAREVAKHSVEHSRRTLTPEQAALREAAGRAVEEPEPQPGHVDVVTEADRISITQDWAELVRTQPAETALEQGLLSKMREADPEKRRVGGDDLKPLATLSNHDLAPSLLPLRDQLADESNRDWIADVLLGPKAMDFAVQASGASIQAEQLQNALRDALEAAASQGVRVVFFFEDWGSVTGVRSGLLEAFTSMDNTHTAVIADTTRELRKLQDNVADRSIAVFEIGTVSESFGLQLAGRALNAVRVGGAALYHSSAAQAQVMNQCSDCAFVRECHATFGAVEDEELGPIGLFPLTPSVVRRALARDGMVRTPRAVIMGILRKAIENSHGAFRRSEYPTTEIAAALAPLERQLDDAARREVEATIGPSRAPTAVDALHLYREELAVRSLAPELAEAFELPQFSREGTGRPCPKCNQLPCCCPINDDSEEQEQTPPPPPKIPDLARDAEHFGRSEALRLGNSLRDTMFEYSVAGVGFGNGIATRTNLAKLGRLSEARFGLEDTRGPHVASAAKSDAPALRALAWAIKATPPGSWREQDNGHRRRAAALNLVARWTDSFDQELRGREGRRQRSSLLLPYLAVLNAIITPSSVVDGPADLLNLALSEATPDRLDSLPVSLKNALDGRGHARQEFLADLALVQGATGLAFGVDVAVIYESLREQHEIGLKLPEAEELPKPLRAWGAAVERTLDEARAELDKTLDAIAGLPEPVTEEQIVELDGTIKAIRRTIAELPGQVATAEINAIDSLQLSLEKAETAPPIVPLRDIADVGALRPLELPAALKNARDCRANLQPRAAVTRYANRVVEILGESQGRTATHEQHPLHELLVELQRRTGSDWPAVDESALRSTTDETQELTTVVDQLRAVERGLWDKGEELELERLLDEAQESATQLIALLDEQERLRDQAFALSMEATPTRKPPAPSVPNSIGHLKSGAISEWIAKTRKQQEEWRTAIQVRWEQLKTEYKPANHWEIARLVGDEDAESAFERAYQLHAELGRAVPVDAQDRLEEVRSAEQEAWNSLRSKRGGPALDLAVRIQEHGGWLALADLDEAAILPLIGPDGDQALRFEIRLLED